jgi:hypothetical protein
VIVFVNHDFKDLTMTTISISTARNVILSCAKLSNISKTLYDGQPMFVELGSHEDSSL